MKANAVKDLQNKLLLKILLKLHEPLDVYNFKQFSALPRIWLACLKFELTNQDSAGGKNFTVLTSFKLTGKALKSGNLSHLTEWH